MATKKDLQSVKGIPGIDTDRTKSAVIHQMGTDIGHLANSAGETARNMSRQNLQRARTMHILRGARTYDPKIYGTGDNTPDSYRDTIMKFAPGRATNGQQAGATTDKNRVVWDTNPWPFHPLFGLLYVPPRGSPVAAVGEISADAADTPEEVIP